MKTNRRKSLFCGIAIWGLLPLLLLYANSGMAQNQKPTDTNTRKHVIIVAGQSNTDGRVKNQLLPDYIKAMASDTTDFSSGAYKYCKISRNSNTGEFVPFWPKGRIKDGIWGYDAIVYYLLEQVWKQEFYVVKYAVGGTSIQYPNDSVKGRFWSANKEWLSKTKSYEHGGNSLLLSFTDAIDAAIDNTLSKLEEGYQIDAFLWHQGESDNRYDTKYYDNLKAVIAYVRQHLSEKTHEDYSQLPFIFGTVSASNKCYKPLVEAAMHRIADEDNNAYLIDMSKGELQRDRLHFTEKSAEYLGSEMFKRLTNILHLNSYGFRVAKYKDDKSAALSYTFDDGLQEHYTLVAPALNKLGIKGTFWVNGNAVDRWEKGLDKDKKDSKPRATWKQLREMSAKGHEISSHGWAHRGLPRIHGEALRYEIEHNDTAIYNNIGVFPCTYAYPGNAKNDTSVMVASRNRVATRLFQFSVGSKSTPENLDKRISDLIKTGGWGVTMTHGITYGYDHFLDSGIFWEHLKKVKAQEDKIWIATFRDVATYIKERKNVSFTINKDTAAKKMIIVPELKTNPQLYKDYLTGVLEGKNTKSIVVKQDGKKLKTHFSNGNTLFDFNPYGGEITVTGY